MEGDVRNISIIIMGDPVMGYTYHITVYECGYRLTYKYEHQDKMVMLKVDSLKKYHPGLAFNHIKKYGKLLWKKDSRGNGQLTLDLTI
jgi:hypothetical protein